MKKHLSSIILGIIFFVGLSVLLYPTVADVWNRHTQTRAIASYTEAVGKMDKKSYEEFWENARAYNRALAGEKSPLVPSDDIHQQYLSVLDVGGSGVMGYIEIPTIKVSLPIYHGTDNVVLQTAVGHIEGTSLPIGGEGTHCALSGHRGLPSAKLFTDLDQLREGDVFMLSILDQVLTYEIDQIRIVLPEEVNELKVMDGKDYCTLVTCTPYGVNTHRMLVRGHRIDNIEAEKIVHVPADAYQIDTMLVAPIVAAPLLLLLVVLATNGGKKKKK